MRFSIFVSMVISIGSYPAWAIASQVCSPAELSFTTERAVVRPIAAADYLKSDGSHFIVKTGNNQILVYIPPQESVRVFSFVKTRLNCEASIGFIEHTDVERGLVASFFPLASVGKNDKFLSLVAEAGYALPFTPSIEHPLVIKVSILGDSKWE